jgi:hypothetical protein
VAVGIEGAGGHRRAEVGSADPDVDDRPDAAAGGTAPRAVADLFAERPHPVQHRVDVGHDVVPTGGDDRALRRPQGGVEDRPPLSRVDRHAPEHGVPARRHPGGLGDVEQGRQHGIVDALLGVVDAQVGDLEQVAPAAVRVGGEELAEVGRRGECRQRGPRRRDGDVEAVLGGAHGGER